MAQLSELAVLVNKMQKGKTTRGSPLAVGSYGSRTFQSRNPDAGAQKERELFENPILKAMMYRKQTPITDYLRRIEGQL